MAAELNWSLTSNDYVAVARGYLVPSPCGTNS